ncbi:MAG TPA: hypothetical protein DCS43_14630 [Verrucomicrobia bacterium]|nr:hypothetical protein [Verrucomicrobiota bacterium]
MQHNRLFRHDPLGKRLAHLGCLHPHHRIRDEFLPELASERTIGMFGATVKPTGLPDDPTGRGGKQFLGKMVVPEL